MQGPPLSPRFSFLLFFALRSAENNCAAAVGYPPTTVQCGRAFSSIFFELGSTLLQCGAACRRVVFVTLRWQKLPPLENPIFHCHHRSLCLGQERRNLKALEAQENSAKQEQVKAVLKTQRLAQAADSIRLALALQQLAKVRANPEDGSVLKTQEQVLQPPSCNPIDRLSFCPNPLAMHILKFL